MIKKFLSLFLCMAIFTSILLTAVSCSKGDSGTCEHEWSEWEVKKEATCGSGGYSERYCKKCMTVDRKVQYPLPHTFSEDWIYDGTYHWHAAICEHKGEKGDKGRHVWENNVCKICGARRATQGLEYRGNIGEDTYRVHGIGATLDKNIVIARFYNGFDIVEIDDCAFKNVSGLESVSMQLSIVRIGNEVFAGCKDLTFIDIDKNVEYIGSGIIDGCTSLEKLIFRGTVDEWNKMKKASDWDRNCKGFKIFCKDGIINK